MEQNERRSETERHWDNLAMTTITAAPAAVFLIARNGQQEPGPAGDLDLFNTIMALFAIGLYLAVAVDLRHGNLRRKQPQRREERAMETAPDARSFRDLLDDPRRDRNHRLHDIHPAGPAVGYQQQGQPQNSSTTTAGNGAPVP